MLNHCGRSGTQTQETLQTKTHSKVNLSSEYSPSYPSSAKPSAKNPRPSLKMLPQHTLRSQADHSQPPATFSAPNKTQSEKGVPGLIGNQDKEFPLPQSSRKTTRTTMVESSYLLALLPAMFQLPAARCRAPISPRQTPQLQPAVYLQEVLLQRHTHNLQQLSQWNNVHLCSKSYQRCPTGKEGTSTAPRQTRLQETYK